MRWRTVAVIAVCIAVGIAVIVYRSSVVEKGTSASKHTPDRHVRGNLAAPIHVTVYTDFECPHCKDFHQRSYAKLQAAYGNDIVVVYKNFPREEHRGAYTKALAAECVARLDGEDAYWKYVAHLFTVDQPLAKTETTDAIYGAADAIGIDSKPLHSCIAESTVHALVDADIADGKTVGIEATPGILIEGGGYSTVNQGNRGNGTRVAIDYIESLLHATSTRN